MTENLTTETQRKTKKTIIPIRATEDEKQAIKDRSTACKMSVSAYLILLGTGYEPPSKLDTDHMRQLVKINADQGRLGGLLKMWLSNEERLTPVVEGKITALLSEIDGFQSELRELARLLK